MLSDSSDGKEKKKQNMLGLPKVFMIRLLT